MSNHPPQEPARLLIKPKKTRRTMARRMALTMLPAVLACLAFACWLGYHTASTNLSQSLSALPLFKATAQAEKMTATLEKFRDNLFQISKQKDNFTPQAFREAIDFYFRGNEKFVQELGIRTADNNGFLLFRDENDFILLSQETANTGDYSPFQQILIYNLSPQKTSLFPAVFYTPKLTQGTGTPTGATVMRMALPIDETKVLVLGINMKAWSNLLVPTTPDLTGPDDQIDEQPDSLQLSYYFDNTGWVLAEKSNLPKTEWRPDISRRGYTGDFGRPGYDAAFRPWTNHENYWRMVTDVRENRRGDLREHAGDYSQEFKRNRGFLCYAPIAFSSDGEQPAVPIGGIAYFETTPNFFETSPSTIAIHGLALIAVYALFCALVMRFARRLSRPFDLTANEMEKMVLQRDLHYLRADARGEEHASITSSINTLISLAKGQAEQITIMTSTIQQTHAPLPVDINSNISSAMLAGEFGLVGSSEQISNVRENIHKAAKAGTDVLVWGETGTGKELVASAIHKASTRKNGPYISINCGALDENLLMDALFGHVAGAFSDALDDRKGAFLAAQGGTLHLDEIGNASPKVQQTLLRALSARMIRPLGSDKEIPFDTRVVAATNVDLRQSVREGSFRQDLYYRLAIICIQTPPLRKRKEDIPELAAYCILEACKALKKKTVNLSRGALRALTDHDWPGNVREFKNCLTRAVAYAEGDVILPEHLSFEQSLEQTATQSGFPPIHPNASTHAAEYLWGTPSREVFTPCSDAESRIVPASDNATSQEPESLFAYDEALASVQIVSPLSSIAKDATNGYEGAETPLRSSEAANDKEQQPPPSGHTGRPPAVSLYRKLLEQGEINERQMEALVLAQAKPTFTRAEYEEISDASVSSRTIQNDLRQLVELGLLIKSGSGPATCYKHAHSTKDQKA